MEKLNELISKACLASELGKKGITVDAQMLSQIRDEFWVLEKRAEDAAYAHLAELEKQEPVAVVARREPTLLWEWTKQGKSMDRPDGMYLYARPAPAINLADGVRKAFGSLIDACGNDGNIDEKAWNGTILRVKKHASDILREIEEAK